ncbi:S9 family peptidase [Rhodohalobacter sp. 614A]|uniref:S9 family peptidase n=1 Tax=Rhodohalobacter sp. 614A TaxID=2908649 RepID=UPI001F40B37F|nr:S9 family peptidase [Rhodohalobacter sp. 614A]
MLKNKNGLRTRLSIYLCLVVFVFIPVQSQAQREYENIEHALFSSSQLSGESGPRNVVWIEGGKRYSYMEYNYQENTNDIRAYNPETGEDELIFRDSDHTYPGTDDPFSYRSFQWSKDFRYLVFQTDFTPIYRYSGISDYYYYSLEDDTMELIAEDAFTAELSPDGQKVAYHREGEMYVFDLNSGEETQLTFDSKEHFFNGRFGWVYEEEFSLVQAWKWSPDSKKIAYWQTDERHVKRFVSTDYKGQYPGYTDIPYPKVGEKNPFVRIGVVDIETGENVWQAEAAEDELIPRIYWTSHQDQLAIVKMNRQQTHLGLHFFDTNTGEGQLIMEEESSDGWIDVYDFFAGINDYFIFPDEREEFFWFSNRDGYKHIYRYNYEGEVLNQVTEGDWNATVVHAVNTEKERIYYSSTEESPLERHLYSVKFDGSEKEKYTEDEGNHSFSMGSDGVYYIDTWSNISTPRQVELWTTDNGGELLEKFVDNQAVKDYINRYAYSHRELMKVQTSDGTELDAFIIKPTDFDPERTYPLIMMIYGGPGSQGVYNSFETNAWYQFLAQQGYVIANVNNRGSGGYSWDFQNSVYKNLGQLEAQDYVDTAEFFASQYDWIDGDRMAIRGHSYGGYMTSLTMVLHPGVFKVGLVGAPVTDWRLYDTIYTERYMGLLNRNEEGYESTAVMPYAKNLDGNLFVAHSSMDENVHVQNTMQMITAFTNAGKDVDLRIYPPGDHSVSYSNQSYLLLYKTYTNYLNKHLNPHQEKEVALQD